MKCANSWKWKSGTPGTRRVLVFVQRQPHLAAEAQYAAGLHRKSVSRGYMWVKSIKCIVCEGRMASSGIQKKKTHCSLRHTCKRRDSVWASVIHSVTDKMILRPLSKICLGPPILLLYCYYIKKIYTHILHFAFVKRIREGIGRIFFGTLNTRIHAEWCGVASQVAYVAYTEWNCPYGYWILSR